MDRTAPSPAGRVHAVLLGERLDIRDLAHSGSATVLPLHVPLSGGSAFLFRYGVIVFADVAEEERTAFIARMRPRVSEPLAVPERDEVALLLDPEADEPIGPGGAIVVREASRERLLVIADILAKSLVLAYYESSLNVVFDRIEPLAEGLQRGRPGAKGKALLQHIGSVLRTQQKMVGRVEIAEKPEILWDHPELERLFARLEDEYELKERAVAIERKLGVISHTAEIALDLDHQRRSLRVEWYIVALIVFEIAMSLYDRLFG